jgi:hypothetical protein
MTSLHGDARSFDEWHIVRCDEAVPLGNSGIYSRLVVSCTLIVRQPFFIEGVHLPYSLTLQIPART